MVSDSTYTPSPVFLEVFHTCLAEPWLIYIPVRGFTRQYIGSPGVVCQAYQHQCARGGACRSAGFGGLGRRQLSGEELEPRFPE